jgi:hypothetical protein
MSAMFDELDLREISDCAREPGKCPLNVCFVTGRNARRAASEPERTGQSQKAFSAQIAGKSRPTQSSPCAPCAIQ